jgi:hypothetical protein
MMELFKQLLILESQKRSAQLVDQTIAVINKVYNEWKKRKRRINAVDIVTTSINKIANIDPLLIHQIHKAAKAKLVIIIMRCLDIPIWHKLESKERAYKKLYPLIKILQNEQVNTGTNAALRDVIMTRLSAAVSYQETRGEVFVAYETKLPSSYIRFLFGNDPPSKTYRMQALSLPAEFDSLVKVLELNQEKAMKKYNGQG